MTASPSLRCRDDGDGPRWETVNKKVGCRSVVSQNQINDTLYISKG